MTLALARLGADYLRNQAKAWLAYPRLRHDRLIPPPWLHTIGGGDFRAVGEEFLNHFVNLADLKPTDRILDVGSGTGRMATALVEFLTSGAFDGLEIVKRSVDWCNRAYAPYPNFRFHHADVKNGRYNPRGTVEGTGYRFPFPDDSFDFVFLTSVFTHMLPGAVDRYCQEIRRVLAPGGRAFITAYLLDVQSRAQIAAGAAHFPFDHEGGGFYFNGGIPERAVAYDEANMLRMTGPAKIYPGTWRGRSGTSWQDILITRPKH